MTTRPSTSRSLPGETPQSRLNRVSPRPARFETPSNSADNTPEIDDREILAIIDTAREKAGLKLDYLARLAGTSLGQLSGALNGHSGFNVRWMWRWPDEFWVEYIDLLKAKKGTTSPAAVQDMRLALLQDTITRLIEFVRSA